MVIRYGASADFVEYITRTGDLDVRQSPSARHFIIHNKLTPRYRLCGKSSVAAMSGVRICSQHNFMVGGIDIEASALRNIECIVIKRNGFGSFQLDLQTIYIYVSDGRDVRSLGCKVHIHRYYLSYPDGPAISLRLPTALCDQVFRIEIRSKADSHCIVE